MLIKIKNWFLDLVFPIRCVACGEFGPDYLCRSCLTAAPLRRGFECIGCKIETPLGITCRPCSRDNFVDQLLIASDYKDRVVQKAIKTFKYRFVAELGVPLNRLIRKYIRLLAAEKRFNLFADNPLLTPVPLARRRLNFRGFNQSEILAQMVAADFFMPLAPDLLFRNKMTAPQADLEERQERFGNVANIFTFNPANAVAGRTVVLVDDICTTGATLNECARVLKSAGVKKVIALVVARG